MDDAQDLLKRSNPLRADLRWEWILLQGVLALAIGLYALLAEERARETIVFLVGLFLLINGAGLALAGLRRGDPNDPMAPFRLIRAGIGIATGLIVVLDRIVDFIDLNPSRVIAGLGLLGIGLVTLAGIATSIGKAPVRPVAAGTALLLAIWGVATIYQAANDASSSRIIGWAGLLIGAALIALALFRRQGRAAGAPGAAPAA